jgi:hypothetical protein
VNVKIANVDATEPVGPDVMTVAGAADASGADATIIVNASTRTPRGPMRMARLPAPHTRDLARLRG